MERVTVRSMSEDDLPRVSAIEAVSHPVPWTRERFSRELEIPRARLTVACRDGEVVGYLCAWELAGELEIQNIVTDPACRRRGVGAALIDDALAYARSRGCTRLLLEVRAGNAAAIELYRRYAFVTSGIRRGYYPGGEDALLMERPLGPGCEFM